MSTTIPEILVDSTDTLRFVPPPLTPAITSATVRVQTPSTALPDSGDSATLASATKSTTVASTASAGVSDVTLADASAFAPGDSIIASPAADSRAIHLARIRAKSGNVVTLDSPVLEDFASGWVVTGWEVSHALTATETDIAGPGLAVWTVTYTGGEARDFHQQFRVVKQTGAFRLEPDELRRLQPIVDKLRPGDDEDLRETIDSAWKTWCEPKLRADGKYPDRIKSWDLVDAWHATACVYHLQLTMSRIEDAAVWERLSNDAYGRLASSVGWYYDDTDDLPGEAYTEQEFHSVRLLR